MKRSAREIRGSSFWTIAHMDQLAEMVDELQAWRESLAETALTATGYQVAIGWRDKCKATEEELAECNLQRDAAARENMQPRCDYPEHMKTQRKQRIEIDKLTAELAALQKEFIIQNLKWGNAEKECERLRELYRALRIRYFPFYGSPNYADETEANIKAAAVGGEGFAQCVSNLSESRSGSAARIKAAGGEEAK